MKGWSFVAVCAIAVALWASPSLNAAAPPTATDHIVTTAKAFLSALDDAQRRKVMFAFDDAQQRTRWSNFPVSFVPRGGISLMEMNAAQRSAAMTLLAAALSPTGFKKIQQIMDGDEFLKNDGNGGRKPMFGRELYYLSILGTPSEKEPWMLQFGGHHLALNITIAGDRGVLTPTLTGAQPALYTMNGKTVRPLAAESDKAFALLQSLDAKQRDQAVLKYRVADLVLGPGQDGKTIQPEGLRASAMNPEQRTALLDVISEWAGILQQEAAAARMAEIEASLDETWFAWSGATDVAPGSNITAYYRIQGPTLLIEYAPQRLGGDPAMHVHTMYRDPTNDYGRKLVAK